MGNCRTRTPQALKTALAIAAAGGMEGGSPTPTNLLPEIAVVDEGQHFLGHFQAAGHFVVHEAGIDHDAEFGIHDAAFEQRHSNALNHTAVDLALDGQTVQGKPAILDIEDADDLNVPGFGIDFDFGKASAVCAAGGEAGLPLAADGDAAGGQCGVGLGPVQSLAVGADFSIGENNVFGA